MTTLDDIDALLSETQDSKNELNGLSRIPENVDEVIEVLFGGYDIVASRPFAEGHACECPYVEFEMWSRARSNWVRVTEKECEVPRQDIGELSKYGVPRYHREEVPPEPTGLAYEVNSPAAMDNLYQRVERRRIPQESIAEARRASRIDRTASLSDAQERWQTARNSMMEMSAAMRRMGVGARAAARMLSSHEIEIARVRYLAGEMSTEEFHQVMRDVADRRAGVAPVGPGESVAEALRSWEVGETIEVVDMGNGRWTVHRHTAGEESPYNVQVNEGRMSP